MLVALTNDLFFFSMNYSKTFITLEFEVCHHGKISKKDLHHFVTFYSIYFLSDDGLKDAEAKYSLWDSFWT